MGGVCTKADAKAQPQKRKEAIEVQEAVPAEPLSVPAPPPTTTAAASLPVATNDAAKEKEDGRLNNFVIGEGDGIYLLLLSEENGNLLQVYAHDKPTASDDNLLLIQVKPPVYVKIKESRFTLQGGKRMLKTNVSAALKTKDGKHKVCEAVVEFIRLGWVYSAYLHAFPHIEQSPFSVLFIQTEHHKPDDLVVKDEETFVVETSNEKPGAGDEQAPGAEEPQEAKKMETKRPDSQPSQRIRDPKSVDAMPEKPLTVFGGNDEVLEPEPERESGEEVSKDVLVVRHAAPGTTYISTKIKYIVVLPMAREEALQVFKEGRVVGEADLADIKTTMAKHQGAMTAQADAAAQ